MAPFAPVVFDNRMQLREKGEKVGRWKMKTKGGRVGEGGRSLRERHCFLVAD